MTTDASIIAAQAATIRELQQVVRDLIAQDAERAARWRRALDAMELRAQTAETQLAAWQAVLRARPLEWLAVGRMAARGLC